jgi:hypothetical protein
MPPISAVHMTDQSCPGGVSSSTALGAAWAGRSRSRVPIAARSSRCSAATQWRFIRRRRNQVPHRPRGLDRSRISNREVVDTILFAATAPRACAYPVIMMDNLR